MSARFDQVAPDLVQHLTVHVGDHETVVALLFDTSRTPYVIRTGRDGAELEVPIRDGTRTRSARRHEILRMLTPALHLPAASIINASISMQWNAAATDGDAPRPERLWASGTARIYVEHTDPASVFLPAHRLHGLLTHRDVSIPISVKLWHHRRKDDPPPPRTGLEMRPDGVAVMGPGAFSCHLSADVDVRLRDRLATTPALSLDLRLEATGASSPIAVGAQLHREPERDRDRGGDGWAMVGQWSSGED